MITAVMDNSDSTLGYPLNFIDYEAPDFHWQDEQFSVSAVALSHRVSKFAQQAQLPNLVLTHFSSRYQLGPVGTPHINQLAAEAMQHYHGQLFLARDFDTYRLAKDLSLSCLTTRTTTA